MKEPFELEVGEIVELGGESYVCVKDDRRLVCGRCAFCHTIHCGEFVCIADYRKDETDVHFERQKGAATSQIISK